jgi:hypothetical protein
MLTRRFNLSRGVFAVATLILLPVLAIFVITCSDKGNDPVPEPDLSGCKEYSSSTALKYATSPDQDCIEYSFSNGVLHIKHVNAAFNCCSDANIDVSVEGNIITIEEIELSPNACHCLCLYDFQYAIANLQTQAYTIKILEPLVAENDTEMEFTVDFATEKSGTFCLTRDYYPWGYENNWTGFLKDYSECGGFDDGQENDFSGDTLSCAIWEYNSEGTLSVRHTNAVLNCCPVFVADISVENNVITITEIDSLDNGGCDCICPFDIDYEITDLWSGEYTLKFVEPYFHEGEDTLQSTINLVEEQSGSFCVDRKYLPAPL